jgi:hypothetical protein
LRRNDREVAAEYRALSTTDGAGGDCSPPLWMVEQPDAIESIAAMFAATESS